MKNIDFNTILDRNKIKNEIIDILINFEKKKKDISHKRGLYIWIAWKWKNRIYYRIITRTQL